LIKEKVAPQIQVNSMKRAVYPDSSVPGLLARHPNIGLFLFIFGALVFGGLTYNLLAHGPLLALDNEIANYLPMVALQSPPYIRTLMDAGFYIGKEVLIGLALLIGIFFLIRRHWKELAMLVIGVGGSSILFMSLSALIGRERPVTQLWIIVNLPGFPSGHAISTVAFYGLMAYLLIPRMSSAFWKGFVAAAALLIISFVGFSRVFTGGHYLTDVLAGYAVGIAWSGLIYTLIELYAQRRRINHVKKE
jgi:undecaprenyl-diphosphatase